MKFKIRTHSLLVLLVVITVGLLAMNIQAQTRRSDPTESVTYEQVLDFVFRELFVGRGSTGYGVGIRYTPSQGKELQLSIMETREGRTEVLLFTPLKDSIRDQFETYTERHRHARFEQVLPKIKVRKQVLSFSTAEIHSLRQEMLDVIERSIRFEKDIWPRSDRDRAIYIHPDGYQMWYGGVSNFALGGGSPDDAPEPPFITWMKEKRPLFEKWAATVPPK